MNNYENTKVLMAVMGMEIGGAETHVLELCKALHAMGLDIYVVSNGGVYEKELIEAGIKHFKIPLHNKKPKNLITSYFAIKRIIIENDIRLVHAHARIPAFICGLLQKKLHFSFVTTAHLDFSTTLPYKVLTNWGEATLAVSKDIRKYLTEHYKVDENNIITSINGIDYKKYSPDIDFSTVIDEFSLSATSRKIVYMSRLDKDRSLPAHKLIEISSELREKYDCEIIIVGAGDDFDNLVEKTKELSAKVVLAGARIDVNKFLALADIFIGVSRSALEAMACQKPVILSGNQGHIGIFTKDCLESAIDTNFTCRGFEQVTCDNLKRDIFTLLNATDARIKELSVYGRQTIIEKYSVQKMADDALHLYTLVRKRQAKTDAMVVGYYGSNNHGDDALLKAITEDLREHNPQIKITAVARRPKEVGSFYNINSIHKFNFPKILRQLRQTNLLIMGGGSLIQDFTSTKSLIYYLFVMKMAFKRRAKVMLYANGIGPLRMPKNKTRALQVLEKTDLITLRDANSLELLKKLGLKNESLKLTTDAAYSFINAELDDGKATQTLNKIGIMDKDFYCVSLRGWRSLKDDFAYEISIFCNYMYEKHNLVPLFIPMQASNDTEIMTQVVEKTNLRGYYLEPNFSVSEILSIISKSKFLVGMRLHSLIYAISVNTPIIGLEYDPKVKAVFDAIWGETAEFNYTMPLNSVYSGKLIDMAQSVLANRGQIKKDLEIFAKPLADLAKSNAQMAYDIINRDLF